METQDRKELEAQGAIAEHNAYGAAGGQRHLDAALLPADGFS